MIKFGAGTMAFLETERLLFRAHLAQDESEFVRMQTDPEVRRHVGGQGLGWSLEKAENRFQSEYLGRPKETYGLWATILKEDGKYIGCCGLCAAQDETAAHLGYYFAQPYWRQGFASEATKAFIELAFTRLRLLRLWADVELGNTASEHILRKFGFKYVSQEQIPSNNRVILL